LLWERRVVKFRRVLLRDSGFSDTLLNLSSETGPLRQLYKRFNHSPTRVPSKNYQVYRNTVGFSHPGSSRLMPAEVSVWNQPR
jgi:hypothetical protein